MTRKQLKLVDGKLVDVNNPAPECYCHELARVDQPCEICLPVTRLVNMHHTAKLKPADHLGVYIGRPSKWSNPFSHVPSKYPEVVRVATREHAVRNYLLDIRRKPHLMRALLPELEGRVLQCYCAPELCHGDVLLALIAQERCAKLEADPHASERAKLVAAMRSASAWSKLRALNPTADDR